MSSSWMILLCVYVCVAAAFFVRYMENEISEAAMDSRFSSNKFRGLYLRIVHHASSSSSGLAWVGLLVSSIPIPTNASSFYLIDK